MLVFVSNTTGLYIHRKQSEGNYKLISLNPMVDKMFISSDNLPSIQYIIIDQDPKLESQNPKTGMHTMLQGKETLYAKLQGRSLQKDKMFDL